MDILDIIILVALCILFYKGFVTKSEQFSSQNDLNDLNDSNDLDDRYIDDLFKKMSKESCNKEDQLSLTSLSSIEDRKNLNKDFLEQQFHNDYRDTITAFNNIAPSQKQLFNRSDFPVKFIVPKVSEVKELVKSFIKEVNRDVKNSVGDFIGGNSGWDEAIPEKAGKSGWDKFQEKLGLPSSIYNQPAKRAKVKLIRVDHLEKYATDEQIRYVIYLILQKINVKDQMVVRLSLVLNNMFDERQFFTDENKADKKNNVTIAIEEIFVMGFLVDSKYGSNGNVADFYNFEGIEKDGIMDQKEILKQLEKKYNERKLQSGGFSTNIPDQIVGINPSRINDIAQQRSFKQNDPDKQFFS